MQIRHIVKQDWTGFVKHGFVKRELDWICKMWIVKHGFVKYGFENKYFVILFLEDIFLGKFRCLRFRLILLRLSIPTLRKFLLWLHLTVNCYHQFSNFLTHYNIGSSFLIHFPLSLTKNIPFRMPGSGKISWPLTKRILHNLKRAQTFVFRG